MNPPDQNRFYEIAFGSAIEVVNLLIICNDLEYFSNEDYALIRTEMEKLTYHINKLSGKNRRLKLFMKVYQGL
ncbi:MAG: four helix bundle protein [Lewinellaceae bacterium]|nr:four helix bundle protein [Lewinellaceae bacterium]